MFPLLGYASSMIGGDSVMDLVDRLNLWRILDIIWLPILLRLVFGIWLISRGHHVSSSGLCFFDDWR